MSPGLYVLVLALISLPGAAVVFALMGNRLNVAFSVAAGGVAAAATLQAEIPYLTPEIHGAVGLGAFIAGFQIAAVVSLGLGSLAAPSLGMRSWVNGDPDDPHADIIDLWESR